MKRVFLSSFLSNFESQAITRTLRYPGVLGASEEIDSVVVGLWGLHAFFEISYQTGFEIRAQV